MKQERPDAGGMIPGARPSQDVQLQIWRARMNGRPGKEVMVFDVVVTTAGLAFELRAVRLVRGGANGWTLALPVVKDHDRWVFSVNLPDHVLRGVRLLALAELGAMQQRRAGIRTNGE